MVVLKGALLGVAMFVVFSILYLRAWGMFGSHGAVDVEAFKGIVTHNPLYWTACILMIALGCVIMLMWPVRVSP